MPRKRTRTPYPKMEALVNKLNEYDFEGQNEEQVRTTVRIMARDMGLPEPEEWPFTSGTNDAGTRFVRDRLTNRYPHLNNVMAQWDRRTFAREFVTDHPLVGPAVMAAGIPVDYAAKSLGAHVPGLFEGDSRPGLRGVAEGIGGVLEGKWEGTMNMIRKMLSKEPDYGVLTGGGTRG